MDKIDFALNTSIHSSFTSFKNGEVYRSVINETERALISKALAVTAGNQITASKILGLNRNTLRSKIKKLNINLERFKE